MKLLDPNSARFQARDRKATQGTYLPSERELAYGMNFFEALLASDIRESATRYSSAWAKVGGKYQPLAELAGALAISPRQELVDHLRHALIEMPPTESRHVANPMLRCQIYLAYFGDPDSAWAVSRRLTQDALEITPSAECPSMFKRALAWSHLAVSLDSEFLKFSMSPNMMKEIIRNGDELLDGVFKVALPSTARLADPQHAKEKPANHSDEGGVVVIPAIGNKLTSEGRDISASFSAFVGTRLPYPAMVNSTHVRQNLVMEFPYASEAIEGILAQLSGLNRPRVRPTVLVGEPGSGKTRFARRLFEELGMAYTLVSCGGTSDSAIGGTPRRWKTGAPCIAISAACRANSCGPGVILDEFEKVATGGHGGSIHAVLIGLFEDETARRWYDPYLQMECDLSLVSWILTANDLEGVPKPLLDRCRVVRFPRPNRSHLAALSGSILSRIYSERGFDHRWAIPLDEIERQAILSVWDGGSLRQLNRLMECVIEAREQMLSRQ